MGLCSFKHFLVCFIKNVFSKTNHSGNLIWAKNEKKKVRKTIQKRKSSS